MRLVLPHMSRHPRLAPRARRDTKDRRLAQHRYATGATMTLMTSPQESAPTDQTHNAQIVVVGPDGMPVPLSASPDAADPAAHEGEESSPADLIAQPAKVLRVGSMIKQLLDEVRAAPLDEASRVRLAQIHAQSIRELETGLAPELIEELERLSLPFTENSVPSDAELRIAQAQLVGWLEGLFHGIQTAMFAQQVAARAQFEEMRRRALTSGLQPPADEDQQASRHTGPYL